MSAKVDPRKKPQLELPPRHWRCTVCRKVIPSWADRVVELRIDIYMQYRVHPCCTCSYGCFAAELVAPGDEIKLFAMAPE